MSLRKLKHKLAELIFYAKMPNRLLADIHQVAVDRAGESKQFISHSMSMFQFPAAWMMKMRCLTTVVRVA